MYRSKLGGEYPAEMIQRMDKQNHAEIKRLRSLPENRECAECRAAPTTWASVSLGVFVCMRCSQVHRNLGAHISKVKSCMGTYLWCPDELERMRTIGNARAAALYSHSRPAGMEKPAADCGFAEVDAFARAKYEEKRWIHPGGFSAAAAANVEADLCTGDTPAPMENTHRHLTAAQRQTAANNRASARAKARALRIAKGPSATVNNAEADAWEAAWSGESPSNTAVYTSSTSMNKPEASTASRQTDLIDLFSDWPAGPPQTSSRTSQLPANRSVDLLALFA